MAGWNGFSDEELRRLQNKDLVEPPVSGRGRKPAHTDTAEVAVSGRGRRAAPTNRSRQQLQREKALQLAVQHDLSRTIPPEQRLMKPRAQSPVTPRPIQLEDTPQELTNRQNEPQSANPDTAESTEPGKMGKELDKKEVELREKSRLELLQHEQRMMEEKNKRKKALLSKTIAEKSKRTQAESVKLKRIQRELQALDDMVSCDIGILRGRIEQASWDYSMARKRYEKAEAEFVTAKLDLHKKTDLKEQLTEHLYAIIQQNEQRKARKLEELMQQLELHADEEQLELEIEVERMLQGEEPQTQACLRNSPVPESPKELQTSPSDCDSIHMPLNHQPVGSEVPASVA